MRNESFEIEMKCNKLKENEVKGIRQKETNALITAWKGNFLPFFLVIMTDQPTRTGQQTDQLTNRPTHQPTDGHEGSLGGYTFKNIKIDKDSNKIIFYLIPEVGRRGANPRPQN